MHFAYNKITFAQNKQKQTKIDYNVKFYHKYAGKSIQIARTRLFISRIRKLARRYNRQNMIFSSGINSFEYTYFLKMIHNSYPQKHILYRLSPL